jgi:hypothetical protein
MARFLKLLDILRNIRGLSPLNQLAPHGAAIKPFSQGYQNIKNATFAPFAKRAITLLIKSILWQIFLKDY